MLRKKIKAEKVEEKENLLEEKPVEEKEVEQQVEQQIDQQIALLQNQGVFNYYLLNNLSNLNQTIKNIGLSLNNVGELLENSLEQETEEEEK